MIPIFLLIGALLLWMGDTSWQSSPGDALPVIAGLPLFLWLIRSEWQTIQSFVPTRDQHPAMTYTGMAAGGTLFLLGMIGGLLFVGALGWTILLGVFLYPRIRVEARSRIMALLPIVLFSFPWLISEGLPLGWWFRLSGAAVTGGLFNLVGFAVTRNGTQLLVEGMPISVEAACSGLNLLQSLLLIGLFLAAQAGAIRSVRDLPLLMAALVGFAWFANTLRIILLCGLGLTVGVVRAQDPLLHEGLGLVTFATLFILWRFLAARLAIRVAGSQE